MDCGRTFVGRAIYTDLAYVSRVEARGHSGDAAKHGMDCGQPVRCRVLGGARSIRSGSNRAAETTVDLAPAWVADGVSDSESEAIAGLTRMDADAAARVIDMPFLQTLDAADAAALNSLAALSADQLADVLSRPMLQHGITDDETPIVAALTIAFRADPHPVDTLLNPDATTVERRTVELPLAGDVELGIVRTRPGLRQSMDLLENAVRESENLMGEPLPVTGRRLLITSNPRPRAT